MEKDRNAEFENFNASIHFCPSTRRQADQHQSNVQTSGMSPKEGGGVGAGSAPYKSTIVVVVSCC